MLFFKIMVFVFKGLLRFGEVRLLYIVELKSFRRIIVYFVSVITVRRWCII